jgi:hypothetical protein
VAASIAGALAGASADEMVDAALAHVPHDSWTFRALARTVTAVREAPPGAAEAAAYAACVVSWFPWADIAPEAVALAYAALLIGGDDFRQVVLAGVNFGRDADTIGAIAGSLAGARLGAMAIPEAWRATVRAASGVCLGAVAGVDIRAVAERLVREVAAAQPTPSDGAVGPAGGQRR